MSGVVRPRICVANGTCLPHLISKNIIYMGSYSQANLRLCPIQFIATNKSCCNGHRQRHDFPNIWFANWQGFNPGGAMHWLKHAYGKPSLPESVNNKHIFKSHARFPANQVRKNAYRFPAQPLVLWARLGAQASSCKPAFCWLRNMKQHKKATCQKGRLRGAWMAGAQTPATRPRPQQQLVAAARIPSKPRRSAPEKLGHSDPTGTLLQWK